MGEVRADWQRVPEQTRKWVATCIGARARVVRVAFIGVSSTAQHSVDVADGRGVVHPLVLRRFVRLGRLATDPWYRPDREAAALRLLERSPVPAPRLVAADLEARTCESDKAALVEEGKLLVRFYYPGAKTYGVRG